MQKEIEKYRGILLAFCIFALVILVLVVSAVIWRTDFMSKNQMSIDQNEKITPSQVAENIENLVPTRVAKTTLSSQFAQIFYDEKEQKVNENDFKFRYEFAPDLLNLKPILPKWGSVYAQEKSSCSSLQAPEKLDVFLLARNLTPSRAGDFAKYFAIDETAYSAPNRSNPNLNDYFFTNIVKKNLPQYLIMQKSNAYFSVHNPPISSTNTTKLAQTEYIYAKLKQLYPYLNDLPPTTTWEGDTILELKNKLPLTMIGPSSINSLEQIGNICELTDDQSINSIKIEFSNAKVQNVHAFTRYITKSFNLASQDAVSAVRDSNSTSLIQPEIIGITPPKEATIKIEKVKMVYADFGLEKAQCLYVPLYLVQGSTTNVQGGKSNVISAFSAVPLNSLQNLCGDGNESVASSSASLVNKADERALKFDTFRLKEASESAVAKFDSKYGSCTGNQVDYTVTCRAWNTKTSSFNGNIFCSQFFGVKIENNLSQADPLKICSQTCRTNEFAKTYQRKSTDIMKLCESTYWDELSKELESNPNSATKGKPLPPRPVLDNSIPPPNIKNATDKIECNLSVCPC